MATERVKLMESSLRAHSGINKWLPYLNDEDRKAVIATLEEQMGQPQTVFEKAKRAPRKSKKGE